jgi:hypothetical protein
MSANSGVNELEGMKQERRTRQPLTPRHPKTEAEEAPAPALPQQAQPTPEEKPVPTATMTPPAADTSSTGGITIYITPEAVEAARLMRRPGVTNAHIALQAVEALQDKLRDLVKARRSSDRTQTLTDTGLFPARSGTAAKSSMPRRTMWSVRLTRAEIDVLDRLGAAVGAASRSELVSVAVEAYVSGHSVRQ